jgi:hypothetical protein
MSLLMLHRPADIIRWLLIDLGVGTDPEDGDDWPIYVSNEPDEPDSCITIYDTAGQVDGRSQIDGEIYEHYGFMIRVRGVKSRGVYPRASLIAQQMAENVRMETVVIDGGDERYLVHAINRKGGMNDLGKETPTSERNIVTINAIAAIHRTV